MTTSAAGNVAGRAGEKEKVEKRRALGRGLASLLPGPRVVAPGQSSGADGKQQIPHFVRNDNAVADIVNGPVGEAISGVIRAEVQEAGGDARATRGNFLFGRDDYDLRTGRVADAGESGGQPGDCGH